MSASQNNKKKPRLGDILGLNRKLTGIWYEHYGVYVGDDRVIHYTPTKKGLNLKLEIKETSFNAFLKNEKEYFVLQFDRLQEPTKSKPIPAVEANHLLCPKCARMLNILLELREMVKKSQMKLFTPEETVARAKSRLGEKKYNLLYNNCEHFAIWCKTGLSKSYQIDNLLKVLKPTKGL